MDNLVEQLNAYENQLEAAKANVYRLDGIIQFIKHLIEEEAKKASVPEEAK